MQVNELKTKICHLNNILDIIRPYLSDMINDHETQSERKIQLTMQISFIFSKDTEETRTMHTKSHNIEIIMGSETNDIFEELRESLLQKYQEGLEESMRRRDFACNSIDLLYYHLQKIGLKRGGSYIDSPEWLKNKKATINPKNNDDNCFKYALTVALNHKQIKGHPERILKMKSFIDQYNWKEIDYLSHSKDWKKFEQNNKRIALSVLLVPHNTKKPRLVYKSNIILSVKIK